MGEQYCDAHRRRGLQRARVCGWEGTPPCYIRKAPCHYKHARSGWVLAPPPQAQAPVSVIFGIVCYSPIARKHAGYFFVSGQFPPQNTRTKAGAQQIRRHEATAGASKSTLELPFCSFFSLSLSVSHLSTSQAHDTDAFFILKSSPSL